MNLLKRTQKHNPNEGKSLIRPTRPEGGLSRLRHEMDRVFDRFWKGVEREEPLAALRGMPAFRGMTTWPAMDMAEDDKAMTLRMDVPGLNASDLDVEVSGNLLTVRGSREEEFTDKHQRRRERRSGSFMRTVTLPDYVDPDNIEAKYEKGVLTVTLPKIPGQGPKRVPVVG